MSADEGDLIGAYYEKDDADDDECMKPGAIFRAPILEFDNEP